jgi:hypothetical protein
VGGDREDQGRNRYRQHLVSDCRFGCRVVSPHKGGASRAVPARDRGSGTPSWSPYDALTEYLDELDEYGVPKDRRVVAVLGPQVLKLAARRSAGAHPYLTTPEHTARARAP